jgi:hypothetical protein
MKFTTAALLSWDILIRMQPAGSFSTDELCDGTPMKRVGNRNEIVVKTKVSSGIVFLRLTSAME